MSSSPPPVGKSGGPCSPPLRAAGGWGAAPPPVAADGARPSPPAPPPPPRNWTFWATTSVMYRLLPSLSSQLRVRSEPSTYTCRPFSRYLAQFSAVFPHTATRTHSVRSCFCPCLSVYTSLQARRISATACP